MHSKCVFKHFNALLRLQNSLLAFFWIGGLLVGILLGIRHSVPASVSVCASIINPPSLLTGILITMIPVLLLVLILLTRCYFLSYPLLFVYALCHGFCGALLSYLWGSSVWLIRLMILFPAAGVSFLIWFLLQRYQQKSGSFRWLDIILTVLFLCCICIVNHFSFSPVLAALLNYF